MRTLTPWLAYIQLGATLGWFIAAALYILGVNTYFETLVILGLAIIMASVAQDPS